MNLPEPAIARAIEDRLCDRKRGTASRGDVVGAGGANEVNQSRERSQCTMKGFAETRAALNS